MTKSEGAVKQLQETIEEVKTTDINFLLSLFKLGYTKQLEELSAIITSRCITHLLENVCINQGEIG